MRSALTRRLVTVSLPIAALSTATSKVIAASRRPNEEGLRPVRDVDPIFAQIELHKTLLHRANTMPGQDDDPAFLAAVDREEAAIQALGGMIPATIAGAAAQLAYMGKIEGGFASNGSPLLKTVLSVATGLASLDGRSAHA